MKILLAVDGSECSARTVTKVAELAAHMRAPSVHVINVQEAPVLYGAAEAYLPYERAEQAVKEAGRAIAEAAAQPLHATGLAVEAEVCIGDVAQTIARRASELGADLIVMGTRGVGAVAKLVLGSTATKVVHLTSVPVLLVH